MHLPFTPNHVQLISGCYPPQAALLTSGPDYRPNPQELSRLVYYAANKPGKINKLAAELEKRLKAECRKAQAGNTRSRASLLITLAIFKALVTECRRDISLLSSSLLSSVNAALSALPSDLELSAKAASVFNAWTTYTDGHLIGVDRNVTEDYMSILNRFSEMSKAQSDDHEIRNRTRLVGLAALDGVVSSEALFHPFPCFKDQVSKLVSAVLVTFYQAEFSALEHEASIVKEKPNSPNLAYLPRSRPVAERRAHSVHLHQDGDKGPSFSDVTDAALRVYRSLVAQSHAAQLGLIMQAAFESLHLSSGWTQVDHCRWLAQASADWAQYQYRYAIPTRLIERLLETQDAPSKDMDSTLTAMVITVFVSPTPLVNLSTSDMVSNLISLIIRRTAIDPDDALLPALVQSMASLGTHVYYADQIQDLAGELISRLVLIEGNAVRGKSGNWRSRCQAIRCLLAGLLGLIQAADGSQAKHTGELDESKLSTSLSPVAEANKTPADLAHKRVHPSRRTKVSPEVWLDTLTLLCDGEYAVRADYSQALLSYISFEIPKKGDHTDTDGVKRIQPLSDGPTRQAKTATAILYGDSVTRFLNALHAYIYALATSNSLGAGPPSTTSPSPAPSTHGDAAINVIPPTPNDSAMGLSGGQEKIEESEQETNGNVSQQDSPPHSESQSRRSTMLGTRSRHVASINRLFDCYPNSSKSSTPSSASLSDFTHILDILTLVHEQLPLRALLTSVPMLLSLAQSIKGDGGKDASTKKTNVIREVLARVWLTIGKVWDCQGVVEVAEKTLSQIPYPSNLPNRPRYSPGEFGPPSEPVEFPTEDLYVYSVPEIDLEPALAALVANRNVLEVTGLDSQNLLARLTKKWTPDQALKESVEAHPSPDAFRAASLLKVTPTLMNIDNLSLQSLGRFNRGVGVTDLRDALEGRNSMSNPALVNQKPASISTLDHPSSFVNGDAVSTGHVGHPPRSTNVKRKKKLAVAQPGDVRNALDALGIRGGNKTSGTRKPSPSSPIARDAETLPVVQLNCD